MGRSKHFRCTQKKGARAADQTRDNRGRGTDPPCRHRGSRHRCEGGATRPAAAMDAAEDRDLSDSDYLRFLRGLRPADDGTIQTPTGTLL